MHKETEAARLRVAIAAAVPDSDSVQQYTVAEQHKLPHHLWWHDRHTAFMHEAVKGDAGCPASHSLDCESIQAPQLHAQAAGLEVTVLEVLEPQ